jgi:predicted esterase
LRRPLVATYDAIVLLDCGFHCRDIVPIKALNRVDVPVYFCHGCEDELVPLAEGKVLHDYNHLSV